MTAAVAAATEAAAGRRRTTGRRTMLGSLAGSTSTGEGAAPDAVYSTDQVRGHPCGYDRDRCVAGHQFFHQGIVQFLLRPAEENPVICLVSTVPSPSSA